VSALLLFYLFTSLSYLVLILWLVYGVRQVRDQGSNPGQPSVSVIIPARNEAGNLGSCIKSLQQQTYPAHLFDITIVDDGSLDETASITQKLNVRYLLSATIPEGWSPKKAALSLGIQNSSGEIVLTTDADCTVAPGWIETLVRYFEPDVGAVVSWVDIQESDSLLSKLEVLDVWSFQIVGAAAIGHGRPFLANGANWGYRRKLFEQVDGFSGIESLASGDDDLLLQKMARHTGWRTAFADTCAGRVTTRASVSLRAFFMQRLRWASKTKRYPLSVIILEAFIFFYNGSLLLLPLLSFKAPSWLLFLLVKFICDASLFCYAGVNLNLKKHWPVFLLAQWWQVLYTVLVGLFAWRGRFVWKDRHYSRGTLNR
jgi:cellulose synthase/poly-beta-1,6-N-acetylglucosamine synthase-like glycosyltransferase